MNCPECQDVLQRRLDGEAPAPHEPLDAHLAHCAVCRQQFAAAQLLLETLKATPRPVPPADFASRIAGKVLRDRERRRVRLRRSLWVTAALAASIILMLLFGYFWNGPAPAPEHPGPFAQEEPKKPAPPAPQPPEPKKADPEPSRGALAALTGKLADKTLDQAHVLWTATNAADVVPMGNLPPELNPAAQPIRQAGEEAAEGLSTVTRSARRAIDYFAREMPMLDVPAGQ